MSAPQDMLAECSGALVDGVGALDATGIRFSEVFEPPQIGCITEWPPISLAREHVPHGGAKWI